MIGSSGWRPDQPLPVSLQLADLTPAPIRQANQLSFKPANLDEERRSSIAAEASIGYAYVAASGISQWSTQMDSLRWSHATARSDGWDECIVGDLVRGAAP